MADSNVRGRFVWHELWTPNRSGAQEFYGQTVGWQTQPWQHDESYSMFVGPQGPLGAAVEDRGATPQWLPYIATVDVDSTVETATRLGARVHTEPANLPDAGRYAVLTDPQGAAFGVHASGGAPMPESTPAAGEFSWHELATSVAPEEAFAFYAQLFDWDEISRYDMGPMGMYLIFGREGTQLGGMFDKGAAGRPGAAYWLGYVNVEDLDAATARAKAARASVLAGPMEVPGGDRIAQLMDPHGAFFALHVRAADAAAAPESRRAAQPRRDQAPAAKAPAKRRKKAAAPKPRRRRARRAPAKKPPVKKTRKKAKTVGSRVKKKPPGKAKRPAARGKPRVKTAAKKKKRR